MTDDYDEFTKRMTSFDLTLDEDVPLAQSDTALDIALSHYGVKGMKWGQRKVDSAASRFKDIRSLKPKSLELKTKNGETVFVKEGKKPFISAVAAAAHPKLYQNIKDSTSVSLHVGGKKVGDADFMFNGKNREEMYLNMIQVDPKQRGKGYASTVLDAAVELGQKEGSKRVTLEVPGNAPDAKHIYKKLGFKESGPPSRGGDLDLMWGGLTRMELDISSRKIKHADTEPEEVDDEDLEKAFDQHFRSLLTPDAKKGGEDTVAHNDADDFLAHYGVKGMKWGVRRAEKAEKKAQKRYENSSEDSRAAQDATRKIKKGGSVDALSNKELQALVQRMNLEQQLSGLQEKTKTKSAGRKFAEDIVRELAKETVKNSIKNTVGSEVQGAMEKKLNTGIDKSKKGYKNLRNR